MMLKASPAMSKGHSQWGRKWSFFRRSGGKAGAASLIADVHDPLPLWAGALCGALLGLSECLLTAATGELERPDLLSIWAFDLAFGLATGGCAWGIEKAWGRSPRSWIVIGCVLTLPASLFLCRGLLSNAHLLTDGLASFCLIAAVFLMLRIACARNRGRLQPLPLVAIACGAVGTATFFLNRHLIPSSRSADVPAAAIGIALASVVLCGIAALPGRGFVPIIAAAGLSATLGGQLLIREAVGAGSRPAAAAKPAPAANVLLVTLDTVRRDHLSCYRYPRATSPSLDELARSATLYENAYATSPYTLSSHASLFTGLLPSEHGAHAVPYTEVDVPLSADHDTLAEVLARRGYDTAAFVANYAYLRPATGLAQGFDSYDATARRLFGHVPLLASFLGRAGPPFSPRCFLGWTKRSHEADAITERAIRWLRLSRNRPFFLFVNYLDAHAPYAPPPEYAKRFSHRGGWLVQWKWNQARALSEEDWAFLVDQYDGALAFADHELGRLIDSLRQEGLYEQTLIAVTSDHGEFLGEHGLRGHRQALYESVLQIPMIVKLPGQRTGGSEAQLTTLADLHWLIREALHERLAPPRISAARVVAEYWTTWMDLRKAAPRRSPAWRATYRGSLKLIQGAAAASQLFDLASDPDEQRDLLGTADGNREAQTMVHSLPPLLEFSRPALWRMDPEAEERLRALGYVH
jgi:arylsulfatase A-like enzyme